jgi:hypothetical protein
MFLHFPLDISEENGIYTLQAYVDQKMSEGIKGTESEIKLGWTLSKVKGVSSFIFRH